MVWLEGCVWSGARAALARSVWGAVIGGGRGGCIGISFCLSLTQPAWLLDCLSPVAFASS